MKCLVTGLILVGSAIAIASGSSGGRYLNSVNVINGQFVSIGSSPGFGNPDGCGNADVAIIHPSTSGYKEMLAVAMTALAAEKQVSMWFDGCIGTPWGFTAPNVYSIAIIK